MKTIFYNPKYDVQSKEEKFLLKRRIRLLDKIHKLDKENKWYQESLRKLRIQLMDTEKKLGIKQ